MTSDLSTLLRKEVERAKTEAREEIGQAGKAAAIFGAAGVAGWLALLMLSLAVAWLLDQALNTALSFAIVGIAWTTFHRKEPLSGRPPVPIRCRVHGWSPGPLVCGNVSMPVSRR